MSEVTWNKNLALPTTLGLLSAGACAWWLLRTDRRVQVRPPHAAALKVGDFGKTPVQEAAAEFRNHFTLPKRVIDTKPEKVTATVLPCRQDHGEMFAKDAFVQDAGDLFCEAIVAEEEEPQQLQQRPLQQHALKSAGQVLEEPIFEHLAAAAEIFQEFEKLDSIGGFELGPEFLTHEVCSHLQGHRALDSRIHFPQPTLEAAVPAMGTPMQAPPLPRPRTEPSLEAPMHAEEWVQPPLLPRLEPSWEDVAPRASRLLSRRGQLLEPIETESRVSHLVRWSDPGARQARGLAKPLPGSQDPADGPGEIVQ